MVYRFLNDSLIDINEFITVYDEALFNYDDNLFTSNVSDMEYQIFVGSQSEVNTPGNQGQITVTRFNSKGNGTVSIRFTPARQPNQNESVSQLDYRVYVIPYVGSYN